jgi:hypothetical protein
VTTAVLTGIGAITGRSTNSENVAREVARIHKNFLDDDNLDALMVACVTALSTETTKKKDQSENALAELCRKNIFDDFGRRVPAFLAAKAHAEVAIVRAGTERAYVQALEKCFAAQTSAPDKADAQKTCADLAKAVAGFAAVMNANTLPAPTTTPVSSPTR